MVIRKKQEDKENLLHCRSAKSAYAQRAKEEELCPIRTNFQRDRDRILHSKSFRRLKHKTQVFVAPQGDHYRTRLTHTLEVSQIGRTIARALNLNEDLVEAISLGHDVGHTPFGHIGERALRDVYSKGFTHYEHSLRVVEKLEKNGQGLNLCNVVKDGILKHSKGRGDIIPKDRSKLPQTLEGQIVRISDIVAYVNHDLDDAIRADSIKEEDIPKSCKKYLGETFNKRINTIVSDIIDKSLKNDLEVINISPDLYQEIIKLREFLFDNVYNSPALQREREKAQEIIYFLYEHLKSNEYLMKDVYSPAEDLEGRIVDFIAGMTDNYAYNLFKKIKNV